MPPVTIIICQRKGEKRQHLEDVKGVLPGDVGGAENVVRRGVEAETDVASVAQK